MKLYSSIYLSKLYPCILRNVDDNIYEIYSCQWDLMEKSRTRRSLDEALEKISEFYKNLGISAPTESDFIPRKVWIGKNIYVQHSYDNIYNVIISTGYDSDKSFELMSGLSYDVAVNKAQQILNITEE